MSATVPSPTPAESACPCLPPPQTRLGRRGAGAALADPPALSRRLGTREGGHALPGGRLGRPGLTVPASPPVPEEAEAPPRPLPTDAQDLGSVSHGWREQTCRLACAPFTPRDPPADTNPVVTTPCPPCPQGSPGPGPAASWCFLGWPENRFSYWEATRMCTNCILSFTLETWWDKRVLRSFKI